MKLFVKVGKGREYFRKKLSPRCLTVFLTKTDVVFRTLCNPDINPTKKQSFPLMISFNKFAITSYGEFIKRIY